MDKKKCWVVINVGTPDYPSTGAVRRYLKEFLNDPKVIDLPWLVRKILVNLIIVPFRAPRSAKKYKQLWTDEGSPLLQHMNELTKMLKSAAGDNVDVYGVMRYGKPSLTDFLDNLNDVTYDLVTFLPLYPQYAESTTGSVIELIRKKTENRGVNTVVIEQFYDKPQFIKNFSDNIKSYKPESYDHILFSYHGLPLRQIQKCHPGKNVADCNCEQEMPDDGKKCYRAACYATTRLLMSEAGIPADRCSTSFQSRLSRNWMSPFTDEEVVRLAGNGKRRVLVVPASFVADCLETTIEIGEEYRELFVFHGGEQLGMVTSLNSSKKWVEGIRSMLMEASGAKSMGHGAKENPL